MAELSDAPTPERETLAKVIRQHLQTASGLRQAALMNPDDNTARLALRAWQAERLAHSHADLLASPQCGAAARFFLTDLYGPTDFSQRDTEFERILPLLCSLLPATGLQAIALAIEVDALTEQLDAALIKALDGQALNAATYAAAYRAAGQPRDRERQLALILQTGHTLRRVATTPLVGALLHMMRAPAHAAGLGDLQSFLERGLNAFRAMGPEANRFLATIDERERTVFQQLMNGGATPYNAPRD